MNPITTDQLANATFSVDPSVDPATPQNSVPVTITTPVATVYTIDQVNQKISSATNDVSIAQSRITFAQNELQTAQSNLANWQAILAQITPAVTTFVSANTVAPVENNISAQ